MDGRSTLTDDEEEYHTAGEEPDDEFDLEKEFADENEVDLSPHLQRKAYAVAINKEDPISTLSLSSIGSFAKVSLLYATSLISSLPFTIYAFTFPLGIDPAELTWQMWLGTPMSLKTLALIFAAFSLGVSTLTRINQIPIMLEKLQKIFERYCENFFTFFKNNFLIFMAGIAAIATLALGYYGFIWGGECLAYSAAAINLIMTFGFRINSLSAFVIKIRNLFSEDNRFQEEILQILKSIHPDQITHFENQLKNEMEEGNSLNEATIKKCLLALFDKAVASTDENTTPIFLPTNQCALIKNNMQKVINLGLGTFIGSSFLLFFSQSGYEGIEIISQLIFKKEVLKFLPYLAQLAVALTSGASSGILGFLAGKDLPNTISVALEYARNDFRHAIMITLIGIGCGLSATSYAAGAKLMTTKPNLFGIKKNSIAGLLIIIGNWLLALAFDFNAGTQQLTKNSASYKHFLNSIEKNELPSKTLTALRQHAFFQPVKPNDIEMQTVQPMHLALTT